MKRKYEKPELLCEEYELSTSIAGSCGKAFPTMNITSTSIADCGYKMGRHTIFVSEPACDAVPAFDGADGSYCYQVPISTTLAFGS